VKAGKRVADDASNLQANSPKKIKLDQHNTKAKSPEKKAESVVKLETKEEKIEPELEDDSQSPVKISKSNQKLRNLPKSHRLRINYNLPKRIQANRQRRK
jgi:hypothetical protein